ncbi:MAG TPA: hypothetical protein VIY51_28155 [Xanthobacteraceae bacterium]
MDRNKLAALLESLCERPFAGDQEGARPHDLPHDITHPHDLTHQLEIAHRAARALSQAVGQPSDGVSADPGGPDAAALAAILSGTATKTQCDAFQEAATTSSAIRLEAQSALAYVDGIEDAPLAAPAHLVEQVMESAGPVPALARAAAKGGRRPIIIWSRFMPRRHVAAALAVLAMGGGLSWSLMLRNADPRGDGWAVPLIPVVPVAAVPDEKPIERAIDLAPVAGRLGRSMIVPSEPPVPLAAPVPEPAQALADPCAPLGFAGAARPDGAQVVVQSAAETAKRAPSPPPKTAAAAVADPGCDTPRRLTRNPPVEQATKEAVPLDPQADKGTTYRPAARVGGVDRREPAAVAPAAVARPSVARPPVPAKRPTAAEQAR